MAVHARQLDTLIYPGFGVTMGMRRVGWAASARFRRFSLSSAGHCGRYQRVGPGTSCRARSAFAVEEPLEVERDVGKADLCLGALDADGPDEQAHPVLPGGEDMLDRGANPGPGRIGALALRGERFSRCPAEVDFRYPPRAQNDPLVLLAAISPIRPDRAAGVGRVDQARQLPAIVAGGIADRPG